jgi:hypothetical protein
VSDIRNVMVVTMLIHTISLALQLSSCVVIHNQCSNIKLVSPVYFCNGAVCSKLSSQRIDIGAKRKACFEFNTIRDEFEGALLFKLQRCSDRQRNMDTTTTKADKREAKCVQLVVAYKVKDSKLFLYVSLIKLPKKFTWNENKLKKLYDKNRSWLKEYNNTTSHKWIMDDNTILKTAFSARDLKRIFEISISISEEEIDDNSMRPFCINFER